VRFLSAIGFSTVNRRVIVAALRSTCALERMSVTLSFFVFVGARVRLLSANDGGDGFSTVFRRVIVAALRSTCALERMSVTLSFFVFVGARVRFLSAIGFFTVNRRVIVAALSTSSAFEGGAVVVGVVAVVLFPVSVRRGGGGTRGRSRGRVGDALSVHVRVAFDAFAVVALLALTVGVARILQAAARKAPAPVVRLAYDNRAIIFFRAIVAVVTAILHVNIHGSVRRDGNVRRDMGRGEVRRG